jgi:glycosyltransferase involved in cell wall biosynthesis
VTKLLIIQQYIPSYRVSLFEQLHECLKSQKIELHVTYSTPSAKDAARQDAQQLRQIGSHVKTRWLKLGGKSVSIKNVQRAISKVQPDYIIVEQAAKNLENWLLILKGKLPNSTPIALWGPGRAPDEVPQSKSSKLKSIMTNKGDWFFAYTSMGVDFVVSRGFNPDRVTVVQNSTDTGALLAQIGQISDEDLSNWNTLHGLTRGRTGLFLGGVDSRKGIDFLLQSAINVAERLPGFVLLVGGVGSETPKVMNLQKNGGPVRYLGRLDGMEKAMALKSASALLIPEWVGLVAVDSIVSSTPLVTTNHPSHAPEFDYLELGATCLVTNHLVNEYSMAVVNLLENPEKMEEMQASAVISTSKLQLTNTVENFCSGIQAWVQSRSGKI